MKFIVFLAICLLAGAALQAQTVYEKRGAGGTVFSDQPMPGARAIELPPPNVMESPKTAPPATPAAPPAAPAAAPAAPAMPATYRSLRILFPENDGAIASALAVFDIRLALEPPLLLGEGHYFAATVDGRAVGRRFTANEFTLPQEFWGDAPPLDNQRHQLDVAVLDRSGKVLKQAEPVRFTLRSPVYPQYRSWPRHPPRLDIRPGKMPEDEARTPSLPVVPPQAPPRGSEPGRGSGAILR